MIMQATPRDNAPHANLVVSIEGMMNVYHLLKGCVEISYWVSLSISFSEIRSSSSSLSAALLSAMSRALATALLT